MHKLTCEICGGNDLVKQGEYFVCEYCGTKYTRESLVDKMHLNVNVVVNERHWEEAKANQEKEAKQLDYEISLLEEYKIYYDNCRNAEENLKCLHNMSCLGQIAYALGWLLWMALLMFFTIGGAWPSSLIIIIVTIIIIKKRSAKHKKDRAEAQSQLDLTNQKFDSMYEKLKKEVKLIPEKFWAYGSDARDYYNNYGATNRKELLSYLIDKYRD